MFGPRYEILETSEIYKRPKWILKYGDKHSTKLLIY